MVFVIAKMGMTLTFNYQGQGHFHKNMVEKYHICMEKGSFLPINTKWQVS